jgi:electron transfer flavoprotein alpha subunit
MKGAIALLVEYWRDEVDSITAQLITKGRKLADQLAVPLVAVVLGHKLAGVTAALQGKGMDAIVTADHPSLEHYVVESYSKVIAGILSEIEPRAILIGHTIVGMELAPSVAAKLGAPLLTNCCNLEIADERIVGERPVFEGAFFARVLIDGEPAIVTLQKGAVRAKEVPAKVAETIAFDIERIELPGRTKVIEEIEAVSEGVDITKADIVVSVGRGIGEPENLSLIQELADVLGGSVGCSRPIVDYEWLSTQHQVGLSGKVVAPKVYIACGISGASQHVAGMSDAKLILAINKNAAAPIFGVAHYGVVANLFEILPALIEEAKRSRNSDA